MSFNPRPHTAGDSKTTPFCGLGQFQSTPAHRRATRYNATICRQLSVSIHARTRRATSQLSGYLRNSLVSIHARTRRAT